MAVTLASEALSDAEVTDGIGVGDAASAARLWVRLWPTALSAAAEFVDPAEVPGLAAEALIGTIAAITQGRGPREDVGEFVLAAVRELGEDDLGPDPQNTAAVPEVFVSPLMSAAFEGLSDEGRQVLLATGSGEHDDDAIADALDLSISEAALLRVQTLSALQGDYLARHRERAVDPLCAPAHDDLAAVAGAEDPAPLPWDTWNHLSTCAWCTEAFHDLAFSNVAIRELVDAAALAAVLPVAAPIAAGAAAAETITLPAAGAAPATGAAGFFRGRRGRLGAVAVLTVAALTGIGVLVTQQSGQADRPAAATVVDTPTPTLPTPTDAFADLETPTATPSASLVSPFGTPSALLIPTPALATALPSTPGPTTAAPTSSTPTPKPTTSPRPTKTTSPTPRPTQTPKPSPTPTPSPSPSPSPSPTPKPCTAFQHLLGIC